MPLLAAPWSKAGFSMCCLRRSNSHRKSDRSKLPLISEELGKRSLKRMGHKTKSRSFFAKRENPLSPRKLVSQFSVPDSKDVRAMLARIGYVEEERPLLPGISVRAASVEKLASIAIDSFNLKGELMENKKELPRVLFLMHRWFVPSEELADILLKLYRHCDSTINCGIKRCKHTLASKDCPVRTYKTKICHTMRFWISNFPMYFDLNTALSQAVFHMQEVVRKEDPDSSLVAHIDVSRVPSYDWMRNMSVRSPCTKGSTSSPRVHLVFNMLKAAELAEQLTYMEYKAFRRIRFEDFKHYAVHASLKDNPRLERSVALFNGLSQWIQCMVLSRTTPQQRADVIVKFVDVAQRLREIQNYNTLMAVVGGLTHSSLARLSKTNACLPSGTQKLLMDFTELLSSSNNFSTYRKVLHQSEGFRIPILGVHLKDLILLNTALGDKVEGELINFRKMVQLSLTFTQLMQVATTTLPIEVNMDLVNTIRLSLDLHYTEDEIYELSLAREPRNSLSSPSTPTKPVVFADWVAGISPPDSDTINKHVHDMVEAVFKNYDHDKDGFISHAEFEQIAGNFPFIDSFAVLDADQDGMISRAEMKTYFIRANCHALRRCFKHNFHELTYFKPTFCIHCTGLLWGLIKQGWKCKDCGINAHKHCKDLVVMECRSKVLGLHGRSLNGHRDLTIASKRKMSQRHKRQRASRATQTIESGLSSQTNSPLVTVRTATREENESPAPELEPSETPPLQLAAVGGTNEEEDGPKPSPGGKVTPEFFDDSDAVFEGGEGSEAIDENCQPTENRDELLNENHILRTRVEQQSDQIHTLRSHIGVIRQQTVTFILHQMDTLHMQRDTEV